MVVYTSTPRALNDDVLTLSFPSETDVSNFKERPTSGDSVSEQLRAAISTVLGIRVKFVARVDAVAVAPAATPEPATPVATSGWNVTPIPGSEEAPPVDEPEPEPATGDPTTLPQATPPQATPPPASVAATPRTPASASRYGEAVVRELLGASFLEEQDLAPRDRQVTLEPSAESAPGSAD